MYKIRNKIIENTDSRFELAVGTYSETSLSYREAKPVAQELTRFIAIKAKETFTVMILTRGS